MIDPADWYGKVWVGDCLDFMRQLPDGCVDAVVTDPPYSSGAMQDAARQSGGADGTAMLSTKPASWFTSDNASTWGHFWLLRALAATSRTLLVEGGHFYVFQDWRNAPIVRAAFESAGLRVYGEIIWDKGTPGMGCNWRGQYEVIVWGSKGKPRPLSRFDCGNVFRIPNISAVNREHPVEKPVALIARIVEPAITTGGLVLDPFLGSGTRRCLRTPGPQVDRLRDQ